MRENQTSPAPKTQSLTDRQLVVELLSMVPAARLEKLKLVGLRADKKFRRNIQARIKVLSKEPDLDPLREKVQTCNNRFAAHCNREEVRHG
ncbi:hypothetical protein [Victivallis vadensis]|uniref:hypothetical protein n=1 Tax=Victivallis vadensis TaxID=172901 RepID=UPI0026DC6635|nr:hypothetical protein [Victivallis vadensis]